MLKDLKKLLELVRDTDLQEIHWDRKGAIITLRRAPSPTSAGAASSSSTESPADHKPKEAQYIRSTMVGTFYRSDSPDRPPLVVEGTIVVSGQPVASIEAMKIRKDVVAAMPCKIMRALVANNHAVEYGQPLFEVEPENADV